MAADKVFISYSHDSPEHSAKVLALADSLRAKGVDAELDRYHTRPPHGWPHWCEEQLRPEVSRFVLVVCTAKFRARVEAKVPADEGRGVYWEGAILYNYIYDAKGNTRFVPVLLDDEGEAGIPAPLNGHTRYRLRGFDLTDTGFAALYRELTDQPEVTKPPLGARTKFGAAPAVAPPKPALPVKSTFGGYDIARISAYAPEALVGREAETAALVDAWDKAAKGEAHPHVLSFVALGGEGKTSLVASFANDLAARGWPGCETAFAWSFYRQSSNDQAGASSDLFFAQAFEAFGLTAIERESGYDKGKRLARFLGEKRALLILDGLEPLQYAPSPAHSGELKDEGINALLRGLAGRNAGLCVVTTRYRIADLRGPAAPQRDLASLSDAAGAELLARLGVKGSEAERRRLSAAVKGHALTLEIVGSYLHDAWGGDIAKRDLVTLKTADEESGRGHAFRAMKAYADWFASEGEEGARLLAMLRLTGLFDRPASAACLDALLRAPVIEGLTEALVDLGEAQRNIALSRLHEAKLLTVTRGAGGALIDIDAHPLLREYFACQLRETQPDAAREAHRRLYEHLTTTTVDKPAPTLDDLAPLYQAVAHGCAAGLWEKTRANVFLDRICRGDKAYAVRKLGAFGADLGAVACFFDAPWRRVSPHLRPAIQAWLLGEAGFRLRALGRLDEAREAMRAGLEMRVTQKNWKDAATGAGNLSELELTLGDVATAVALGETSIAHANRSGDPFQRILSRTTYAEALHQADQCEAAQALYAEADAMQAERQPKYPWLYSFQGFRYCDWRLGKAERAALRALVSPAGPKTVAVGDEETAVCGEVTARATKTLAMANQVNLSFLTTGLDHLNLARAALYAAVLRGEPPSGEHISEAVASVRRAGTQDHLPRPLLTRALYRAVTGAFPAARDDLDEAFEIAERGPMRLHLADIHLHRARLFGLIANRPPDYPWTSPRADLDAARKLIETCGYGRRLPELEDAEAALRAL